MKYISFPYIYVYKTLLLKAAYSDFKVYIFLSVFEFPAIASATLVTGMHLFYVIHTIVVVEFIGKQLSGYKH